MKTDGQLWAWGANVYGELGLGDAGAETARYAPVQVGTEADWTLVDGGSGHTVGIRSDGSLWSWGANETGQLGLGTLVSHTTPQRVGTRTDWTDVDAYAAFTMATTG